jgi:hypothetical protein
VIELDDKEPPLAFVATNLLAGYSTWVRGSRNTYPTRGQGVLAFNVV